LKYHDKRETRQPPLAEDREAPVAAFPKTNVQTKICRSLTVGELANASSLYLALLSRSSATGQAWHEMSSSERSGPRMMSK
jgi:hypothetical protein